MRKFFLAFLVLLFTLPLVADEGMWLFNRTPNAIFKQRYGFTPTQAWLDHLQKSSIRFNSGGSGSFVSADGLAPRHMALLLETTSDAAEHRLSGGVPVSLVWSGPESAVSQTRDTAVVVDELFAHAERFVLVSSYVVQKATIVFRSLAERMVARPELHVQLFLHIGREWRDTRDESELLREFGAEFSAQWPGARRPHVFYDPRTLYADAACTAAAIS